MGKTLKIFSYRGVNVYIRFLYSRWYELLVAYRGGVYAHQMWVEKPHGQEKRVMIKTRDESAIQELSIAATALIDNLVLERSLKNRIKKLYKIIYGKITASIKRISGTCAVISEE